MKTFTAFERQPTSIPISEVLAPNGALEIFPEVHSKGYFDLDFRGGELVLVSGKYVGHIPLNSRVLVDIRPKVGIVRLSQLLEKAHEPLQCLDFYKRAYKTDELRGDTIFEVLVRALVEAVKKIATEGVFKENVHVGGDLSTIRGRVNVIETVRRLNARGIQTRASCNYFEFQIDNAPNRLIKYALWYSGNHLATIKSENRVLRRELAELYRYFESVPLDVSMRFISRVRSYLSSRHIPSTRDYYLEACDIALAIISDSGLDLLGEGRDIHLASFLLDMESVFEQYIRNVLKDASPMVRSGRVVMDGNKEGRGWLFSDAKSHEARPDFFVKRNAVVEVLGDVKYKPRISEQDRYQVIAHSLSFGAQKALIVMPGANAEDSRLERLGKVGTNPGVDLYVYRFNLEAQDLEPEEAKFADAVYALAAHQMPLLNEVHSELQRSSSVT